jgi:hypothetical protein
MLVVWLVAEIMELLCFKFQQIFENKNFHLYYKQGDCLYNEKATIH